jgi:O-antigen ligase
LALIGITLSIALTVISLPEGYEDRIKSIFADKEERDHSAAGRPHFWSTAIKMANHYPLGVGPGCFPAFYNDFDSSGGEFGFYRSVHSSHFQILADAGYLGVIVWILIYLVAGYKLIRIRSLVFQYVSDPPKQDFYINLSNALLCVILVFFIGGSFYELAYNDIIWLTFGLIITIEMKIKNLKLTERGCI